MLRSDDDGVHPALLVPRHVFATRLHELRAQVSLYLRPLIRNTAHDIHPLPTYSEDKEDSENVSQF